MNGQTVMHRVVTTPHAHVLHDSEPTGRETFKWRCVNCGDRWSVHAT